MISQSEKFLVLGHGTHGKDTVCEYLRDNYGLKFESSSVAAFNFILPILKIIFKSEDTEYLYSTKMFHRLLWKELILLANTPYGSMLVEHVLENNDIYNGLRSNREYEASEHLFDHIIWVDASRRVDYVDESLEIPFQSEMIKLDNNEDLDFLYKGLDSLMNTLNYEKK